MKPGFIGGIMSKLDKLVKGYCKQNGYDFDEVEVRVVLGSPLGDYEYDIDDSITYEIYKDVDGWMKHVESIIIDQDTLYYIIDNDNWRNEININNHTYVIDEYRTIKKNRWHEYKNNKWI